MQPLHRPADSKTTVPLALRLGLSYRSRRSREIPPRRPFTASVVALVLLASANAAQAQTTYEWTGGTDVWENAAAWTPNGNPDVPDTVQFGASVATNANNGDEFYVTLTNDEAGVKLIQFNNGTASFAITTLDLNDHSLSAFNTTTTPGAFELADVTRCTTTVYVASSTVADKGLFITNASQNARIMIGRNGIATLFITNGLVAANSVVLANGSNARGTLVLDGPNTSFTNSGNFQLGSSGSSKGSALVISNSASLTTVAFRLGWGSGSSSNTLWLDSNGRLFTTGADPAIATGAGEGNAATVQGGGVWDLGDKVFTIGATGSGNSLTIGTGSEVVNISTAVVSAANTLDLQGGLFQVSGLVTNLGTIHGYGTIVGDTAIADGGLLSPANTLGQLIFSNDLTQAGAAQTTVSLGSNFNATVVSSNLTLDGTLNITDGGGLTNGTYTLFTYGGALTTNGSATILTIGVKPDTNGTYIVDIGSSGFVKLDVSFPAPEAGFGASPTNGELPLVVTFTNASNGVITNSFWDFGDGITTNTMASSFDHTYAAVGTYAVSLTVFGPTGSSTNTQAGYIVVDNPPPPVAEFSGSPTTGVVPLPVTFTDNSTGNITNRFWDFGDGGTTNTSSTSVDHTYTAVGSYTISLTASGLGGPDTTNQPNYITTTNVVGDVTPPQLQIDSPADYEVFSNANIIVAGSASDDSGLNSVTINGAAASIAAQTNWSRSVTLALGTNTLVVIATDASANLNAATQTIHAIFAHPVDNAPQIIAALSVTNALLQTGTVAVVVADETNTLSVIATDADSDPLSYQWVFGDGQSTNTLLGNVDHVYTNDCGPYNASVTVSDGQTSTNSDLTVAVACQLQITKLQAKLNFKKSDADNCRLAANIVLPDGFDPSGKLLTVNIGGAQSSFTLDTKNKGRNLQGNCSLKFNKKTNDWTVKVKLNKSNLQDSWADEGLVDDTIPKPGTSVTLRAIVLVGNEGFAADQSLLYKATAGKSGTAK